MMPEEPGLVDIHCHLLPEFDDGAADWSESLAMARLAAADGIVTIVATPHQLGCYAQNGGEMIRARTAQLRQLLVEQGVPLSVLPGAEVRIEPDLAPRILDGEVLTLGDHRRHVLIELPHEVCVPMDRLLAELNRANLTPILAHPERNLAIRARRELLGPLIEAGCLIQVTAGSLTGTFGSEVEQFAQWLVQRQWVDLIATDSHGSKTRRPLLQRAVKCVTSLAGRETAMALCCRNPALVAAGKGVLPRARRPAPAKPHWFGRQRVT